MVTFVFFGTFAAMLMMGLPILSLFQRDRAWRQLEDTGVTDSTPMVRHISAFEPLEMEPFELLWPSAVVRPSTASAELPWPSETWDDPYFGHASDEPEAPPEIEAASETLEPSDFGTVREWVRLHGLTGALKRVREETGWSPSQSAEYLAKALGSGERHPLNVGR